MYRYSLLLVALVGIAGQAQAQHKADGLFEELSRDFGSAPQGQTLMHPFRIVNNTKQPVHIANVRVSCGRCSAARALKTSLQPGEETAIIAEMFTSQFSGSKTITIFVMFDQPRFEEVRLWIQANSRQDVTYAPGNGIEFGRVKRGTKAESKVSISFLGGSQIKVQEPKSDSNYVVPSLKEVQGANGETIYEVTAKLRDDTPAGKWYTDIWLATNNNAMPKLRVPVTVEVEAALSVNPSTVSLGQVKAGTETERKVIIRGARPFRIIGITGTDKELQVRQTSNDSKSVHVLTVTLNPMEPQDLFSHRITVRTDLKNGGEIAFDAQFQVIP